MHIFSLLALDHKLLLWPGASLYKGLLRDYKNSSLHFDLIINVDCIGLQSLYSFKSNFISFSRAYIWCHNVLVFKQFCKETFKIIMSSYMIHYAVIYMLFIILIFTFKLFIKSPFTFPSKFPVSVLLILFTCIIEASKQQALAYFYIQKRVKYCAWRT